MKPVIEVRIQRFEGGSMMDDHFVTAQFDRIRTRLPGHITDADGKALLTGVRIVIKAEDDGEGDFWTLEVCR